jgi:hypothetical protein
MSKRIASDGINGLISDVFNGPKPSGFVIRKPAQGFNFFNSLKIIESDTFSGLNVLLIESRTWLDQNNVQVVNIGNDFSGSFNGSLPSGYQEGPRRRFLIITDPSPSISGTNLDQELNTYNCVPNQALYEDFFVYLRAFGFLSIIPSRRPSAVMNIASQHQANGYVDTPISDFFPYYEEIKIFEVMQNSMLFNKNIFWFSTLVVMNHASQISPYFDSNAKGHVLSVYNGNFESFPIDNLRLAFTTSHFKHSYLEVYRCLESLYSIPRVFRLKNDIKYSGKSIDLTGLLIDNLDWRKNQLDSLRQLISVADVKSFDYNILSSIFGEAIIMPIDSEKEEKLIIRIANYIYTLRNQYAHSLDSKRNPISVSSHKDTLTFVLFLCAKLYQHYIAEV